MKYYIQDFCCICLSISNEKCSNDSSKYADNLTTLDKIKTVFLGLAFVMESDDRICTKCSDTVGFIYEFHKTCLKNINIFSSYKTILKENQPKKQCELFVDLNESKTFKENILTSEKIKVELPDVPLNNDEILLDTDFVSFESHSSGDVEIKKEIEINCETNDGELGVFQLDSEIKIEYEDANLKKESNINERSDFESLKSNIKNYENISVQSTEEMVIAEEENQELIEDPLRVVAEEISDEGQGYSESFRQNHFESFEGIPIHVEQKIDSDSHMVLDSKRKNSFECDICKKLFTLKGNLIKHKLIHTGEKPFKCDICGRLFTQMHSLKRHKLMRHTDQKIDSIDKTLQCDTHKIIHTGEKPHKCNFCGKSFNHMGTLNAHKIIHLKESNKSVTPRLNSEIQDPLREVTEEKSDEGRQDLESISRNHSNSFPEKPIHVDSDRLIFIPSKRSKPDTHKIIHRGEKPHKCDFCGKSFNHMGTLNAHKVIHLKEANKSVTSRLDSEIQDPLRVVAEEKSEGGRQDLESINIPEKPIHVDLDRLIFINSKRSKPFKCDICGKLFEYMSNLNAHKLVHTGEKPYKCDICGKLFTEKSNLRKHNLIHTGEKPHKCDICGKFFRLMCNLKTHKLIVHNGEKPYKCDICGRLFTQMSNLRKHKPTHTDEKPFKCDICGLLFRLKYGLKKHKLIIHTDEKPFKCNFCGKSFDQLDTLNTHKLIHTREKPYKCDICEKLFTQKRNLRQHNLIHTGEKPFKCDICGSLFNYMSNLKAHSKSKHTDVKPHKCDICGKLFRQTSSFKAHKLTHTGDKPQISHS